MMSISMTIDEAAAEVDESLDLIDKALDGEEYDAAYEQAKVLLQQLEALRGP